MSSVDYASSDRELIRLESATPRVVDEGKQQEPTLGKDQQNPVWQQGRVDVMGSDSGANLKL